MTVCGYATVSGKITLQGRPGNNVNPGTVTLTDLGGNFPPVQHVHFNASERCVLAQRAGACPAAPTTRSMPRTACT